MQYNLCTMLTSTIHLILASGSPRRLEILRAHGIEPEVVVPDINEEEISATWPASLSPNELARRLALCKAQAVYAQKRSSAAQATKAFILAADTIVYRKGVGILGKPANHDSAVSMLQALCNTSHQVISGVALIDAATGEEHSFAETSTVHFGTYSLREIEDFIEAEPPFDKAGSYAVQGIWSRHVTAIEGDLENVIGLPYYRLEEFLL